MLKKFRKKIFAVLTAISTLALTAVSASASTSGTGLGDHSAAITQQFQNAASDIIPIIIGILGVGLGIFAIFKGIKLAKKMFGTVSSG